MIQGTLYLIPTFLSEDNIYVLPEKVLEIIRSLTEFIVENEKSARQFLKKSGTPFSQSDLKFHVLDEHTDIKEIAHFLSPLREGKSIGLLSEAGCPAVADPGSDLIHLAHIANIKIIPLVGPSSILLSLMASGMNGQQFVFHGYLPREDHLRKNKIKELEKEATRKNQTQIFIETPYRNQQLLTAILQSCNSETRLCIACDLTGNREYIRTQTIALWKKNLPDIQKRPAIFLIGR